MKLLNLILSLPILVAATSLKAAPQLNGLALDLEFNQERYIAAVYTETLSAEVRELLNNTQQRRLEIRVVAETVSARRLRNQWMEAVAINNPGNILSEQASNMVTFANLLKGQLLAGDQLRVNFAPDTGTTTISLNGNELGVIEDIAFFNTLLRAWIGNIPPSTDFRNALLASGEIPDALLSSYQNLKPSAERSAQTTALIEPQPVATETAELPGSNPEAPQPATAAAVAAATPQPDTDTSAAADIAPPTLAALDPDPATQALPEQTGQALPTTANRSPEPPAADRTPDPEISQRSTPEPENLEPANLEPASLEPENLEPASLEEVSLTAELLLAQQLYHSVLLSHTFKHIRYPRVAQLRNQQGSVRLSVTIAPDGRLKSVQALQESRYSRLNDAALDAVSRAAPYPAVPALLGEYEHTFTLPITFQIAD